MIKLLREGDDTFKGDPDRPIWDDVVVQQRQQYSDKILLPARMMTRIEIPATIIERDPELCRAFTGGLPEVSIFWTDRATGVPMKVRMDYWKPKVVVDYKSFENSKLLPIDMAVAQVVAAYRYQFQMAFYLRAVVEARRLIAQGQVFGEVDRDLLVQLARPQPMT